MALALGTMKLTPAAMADLIKEGPVDRAAYFSKWLEGIGGKLLAYYFAEDSDIDIVTLAELPDDMRAHTAKSIATWAANWSAGMAQHLEVIWLATPEELAEALKATRTVGAPGHE